MNRIIKNEIRDEVMDKAMNLFWCKGYFNTSIDDIVKETGMSRAIIYKYFKDKQGLFEVILNRYYEKITCITVSPLVGSSNDLSPIYSFFKQFIPGNSSNRMDSGCLMMTTASDFPLHNEPIQSIIRTFTDRLYNLFYNVLLNAKTGKTISYATDCRNAAALLVGNTFGIMSLFRTKAESSLVKGLIDGTCEYLDLLNSYKKEF